jgi:hypothetical protein
MNNAYICKFFDKKVSDRKDDVFSILENCNYDDRIVKLIEEKETLKDENIICHKEIKQLNEEIERLKNVSTRLLDKCDSCQLKDVVSYNNKYNSELMSSVATLKHEKEILENKIIKEKDNEIERLNKVNNILNNKCDYCQIKKTLEQDNKNRCTLLSDLAKQIERNEELENKLTMLEIGAKQDKCYYEHQIKWLTREKEHLIHSYNELKSQNTKTNKTYTCKDCKRFYDNRCYHREDISEERKQSMKDEKACVHFELKD